MVAYFRKMSSVPAMVAVLFNKAVRSAYYNLLIILLCVLLSVSGKILARDIAIVGAVLVLLAQTYPNKMPNGIFVFNNP